MSFTIKKEPASSTITPAELDSRSSLDVEKIENKLSSLGGEASFNDIEATFLINKSLLKQEKEVLDDFLSKGETTSGINMSKLSSLLSRSKSIKTVKEKRKQLLKELIDNLFSSNKNLIQSLKSDSIITAKKIIQKNNIQSILQDLSIDAVSKEISRVNELRTTLSYPVTITEGMITSQKNFLDFIDLNQDVHAMTIGLPAGLIENLRRNQSFDNVRREYLEIEVSARHLVYDEKLKFEPLVFRFSTELLANTSNSSSDSNDIKESIETSDFLCFEGNQWNRKSFEDSLGFLSRTTGLNRNESKVILYNHAISDLIRMSYFSSIGIDLENVGSEKTTVITSTQIENARSAIVPLFGVSLNDITRKNEDNQVIVNSIPFTSEIITDESDFRIVSSLISDPVFTYESTYSPSNNLPLFERVLSFLFQPYEFLIDRSNSSEDVIDFLSKNGMLIDVDDSLKLQGTAIPRLNAFQYAITARLVRN